MRNVIVSNREECPFLDGEFLTCVLSDIETPRNGKPCRDDCIPKDCPLRFGIVSVVLAPSAFIKHNKGEA